MVHSNDWTKNIIEKQKEWMLYDLMLRLYLICDWEWEKTSRIKQKNQHKEILKWYQIY